MAPPAPHDAAAFHRRVIENFSARIRAASDRRSTAGDRSERNEPINLTESMSGMTLEVVLDAIFGDDLRRLVNDLDNPFMLVTQNRSATRKLRTNSASWGVCSSWRASGSPIGRSTTIFCRCCSRPATLTRRRHERARAVDEVCHTSSPVTRRPRAR